MSGELIVSNSPQSIKQYLPRYFHLLIKKPRVLNAGLSLICNQTFKLLAGDTLGGIRPTRYCPLLSTNSG